MWFCTNSKICKETSIQHLIQSIINLTDTAYMAPPHPMINVLNVQNRWNWFNIVKHNDKAHFDDKYQLNCVFHFGAFSFLLFSEYTNWLYSINWIRFISGPYFLSFTCYESQHMQRSYLWWYFALTKDSNEMRIMSWMIV